MKKIILSGILISILLISGAGCVQQKEDFQEKQSEQETKGVIEEKSLTEIQPTKTEEKFESCFPQVVKVKARYEYKSPLGYRIICPEENCFYLEDKFNKAAKEIDASVKVLLTKLKINLLEFYPQGIDIHVLNLEKNKKAKVCTFPDPDWGDEYGKDWETAWSDGRNGVACLNWDYLSGEGATNKYKQSAIHYAVLDLLFVPFNTSVSFSEGLLDLTSGATSGYTGNFCDESNKFSKAYAESKTLGYLYRGYLLFYHLCKKGNFDVEEVGPFIQEVGRNCIKENKGNGMVNFGDIKCILDKYMPQITERESTPIYKEWLFGESEKEFLDDIHKC